LLANPNFAQLFYGLTAYTLAVILTSSRLAAANNHVLTAFRSLTAPSFAFLFFACSWCCVFLCSYTPFLSCLFACTPVVCSINSIHTKRFFSFCSWVVIVFCSITSHGSRGYFTNIMFHSKSLSNHRKFSVRFLADNLGLQILLHRLNGNHFLQWSQAVQLFLGVKKKTALSERVHFGARSNTDER